MTGTIKLTNGPVYVVCGDHSIRYPAACHGCPMCAGGEGSMRNRHHDDPTKVEITRT